VTDGQTDGRTGCNA